VHRLHLLKIWGLWAWNVVFNHRKIS
jgi:hypothetical protein